MPRMKKLRLSRSFSSFFLSSEMRRNCVPNVLIVRPQMTLEWHLKTKARINVYNYKCIYTYQINVYIYISYYIIFLKNFYSLIHIHFTSYPKGFHFCGFKLWYSPNHLSTGRSSRSLSNCCFGPFSDTPKCWNCPWYNRK